MLISSATKEVDLFLDRCLSLLTHRRAVALCNNLPLARLVADDLRKHLDVELTIKRLDRYVDLQAFIGDPRNPVSYSGRGFRHLVENGGLLLFEVLEISTKVIEALQLLESLLPRGGTKWQIPDHINFHHIEAHPKFYIVVSLPSAYKEHPLPPSITSRLDIIELAPDVNVARPKPTMGIELGPGKVLVLMKFGITEYEQWYQEVLKPAIEKFGACIRMNIELEDWQSDVTRAIDRSDAIIIDLSHDLIHQLSPGILWEINRLWQVFISNPDSVARKKMICVARGLRDVTSRHPKREFIYSSEVDKNWITDMPTSASNIEDLLGFEIRRYDPTDKINRDAFVMWLEERLCPLVQNIPAPLTDKMLRELADVFQPAGLDSLESKWLRAITERNFSTCEELADNQDIPQAIHELLGDLMTTVSVSQASATPGYWDLTKKILGKSSRLRAHYRALLATKQLSLQDPFCEWFCENVWITFNGIYRDLPLDEKMQLAELAMAEKRMVIREVSDYFRFAYLPEDQKQREMTKLLMEHMGFDG